MRTLFLVLGYGIPKDIFKDENYKTYLKLVFNNIYDIVIKRKINNPLIVFSGGKTDIYKPFKRDEAEEMVKYFKTLAKRSFVKQKTKNWRFIKEAKALSTLENLLFTAEFLQKKKIVPNNIYIFCEKTREKKVGLLAKKIFKQTFTLIPIDFDHSPNRYLDDKFIKDKEDQDMKFALWALENKTNFKKYHKIFQERLAYFRKQGPQKHIQSVQEWWQKKLEEIIK